MEIAGNFVIAVAEDFLAIHERRLARIGGAELVSSSRSSMRRQVAELFRATVEAQTGRRVLAEASRYSVDPEMAVELFALEVPTPTSPNGQAATRVPQAGAPPTPSTR